ncbi:MAG: alpha/beta hydrolase, partial [Bacteroidota bacterium]
LNPHPPKVQALNVHPPLTLPTFTVRFSMKTTLILTFLMTLSAAAFAQTVLPLYPGKIPGSIETPDKEHTETDGIVRIHDISRPTLTVFLPAGVKGPVPAVVICPGGGYGINAFKHEGTDVAALLNSWGVAAFVLKYRIPSLKTMQNRMTGPLQDAQQAIAVIRSRAAEFGVDPNKVGIMGFSAGGHLASTAATKFGKPMVDGADVHPDFQILVYPVISFRDGVGHKGSRDNLLGSDPTSELIDLFSSELQVTSKTPPAFLVHASDDDAVLPENSIRYYQALLKKKVRAELHLYERGGHGFGLNNPTTRDQWTDRLKNWMAGEGLVGN